MDFLEEQSRVVRLVTRHLAGLDTTQLALLDECLEFLVGRAPSGVGLLAYQLTDRGSRSVSATARTRSRALIDSVHDWTPSREESDMRGIFSRDCDMGALSRRRHRSAGRR